MRKETNQKLFAIIPDPLLLIVAALCTSHVQKRPTHSKKDPKQRPIKDTHLCQIHPLLPDSLLPMAAALFAICRNKTYTCMRKETDQRVLFLDISDSLLPMAAALHIPYVKKRPTHAERDLLKRPTPSKRRIS